MPINSNADSMEYRYRELAKRMKRDKDEALRKKLPVPDWTSTYNYIDWVKQDEVDSNTMKQFDNNDLVKLYSVVGPAPDGSSIADFLNKYRKQVRDIMESYNITFNTAFDMLLDKERKRRNKNKFITFDFDEVVKLLSGNLNCQECAPSSSFIRAVVEKKWTLAKIKEEYNEYTPPRMGIHLLDNDGVAQLYQCLCATHLQRINQIPPNSSDVEKLFSVEPFKSMRETYDRVRSQ